MGRGEEATDDAVRCIACDAVVERSAAREYDRFGDRWEREDKRFEFLCKPCHRRECHLPRNQLEATLSAVGTRHPSPAAFVTAYYDRIRGAADAEDDGIG